MPGIHSSDVCAPSFSSFSWHRSEVPPSNRKNLAEFAQDVGSGTAKLLSLIEFSELQSQDNSPFLSKLDKEALLRFAMSANKLLAYFAENEIDRANQSIFNDGLEHR